VALALFQVFCNVCFILEVAIGDACLVEVVDIAAFVACTSFLSLKCFDLIPDGGGGNMEGDDSLSGELIFEDAIWLEPDVDPIELFECADVAGLPVDGGVLGGDETDPM